MQTFTLRILRRMWARSCFSGCLSYDAHCFDKKYSHIYFNQVMTSSTSYMGLCGLRTKITGLSIALLTSFYLGVLGVIGDSLISKGPYVQAPGSNTMTIMWESPVNLPAKVFFGTNGFSQVAVSSGKKVRSSMGTILPFTNFYIYQVTLEGLQPSTTYFYYVQIGDTKTSTNRFRTFPVDIRKVKFIAYGDTRSNSDIHRRIASYFKSFSPDFILHTGDLVSTGSLYPAWAKEFFFPLSNVIDEIPLFPALGNHEEKSDNYFNYFALPDKKNYYAFEAGPLFILVLDYHYSKYTDDQYKFAEQALENTKALWKIVMVHVPMFDAGGHFSSWGHKYYLPLFHKMGVDVAIAGHSHLYERFFPLAPAGEESASPITHITTGGGGAPLAVTSLSHPALAVHAKTNHFLYIEVSSSNLVGKCFDLYGREVDNFEIRKVNGKYDSNYLAQVYPEGKAQLSLEAMKGLIPHALNLPGRDKPAMIMFRLVPFTAISSAVQMRIELAPESSKFYTVVSGDVSTITLPPAGKEKIIWLKVAPKPGVTVKESGDREFRPPLIFQARLTTANTDVIANLRPAYISNTAKKEARKSGIMID